jgi:hypothetical protein
MRMGLLLGSLLLVTAAWAQDPSTEPPLDEVVVNGEFPGPGMWKVTRPNDADAHVLWIIGDPWWLPKRLKWKSKDIEATVLASQEILADSGINVAPDEKVGFFRGVTLVPAALKARHNPDEAKLADVLPPDVYARWLVQKKLYLGRESGVETWRPLFAANKLRKAAVKDLQIRTSSAVWDVVRPLARQNKIPVTTPLLKFTFKRSELRDRIKEFARESLADLECFTTTVALTEALGNADIERARARAWATGDLAALSALPELPSPYLPCVMAVMSSEVARDLVPADAADQVLALWVEAAGKSLADNRSTFAVVPFAKLTRSGGYLDALRAKGFLVEAPQ